ncbi:hypothetical protein [Bdellovibrio sp. HCB274]|uniref:hypothetical protein n=1 Tax=Bdellovibrio sp. HCB274 TaxID=3394361 RepID=UPI0039B49ED1
MKRTKTGITLVGIALGAIISTGHVSYASPSLQEQQTSSPYTVNIKNSSANKNGPVSAVSTGPSEVTLTKDKDLTKSKQLQMGGISDGGGNAVGEVLFDFYENQDSEEITLPRLLSLEPQVLVLIKKLNTQVPHVGEIGAIQGAALPALGDLLFNSLIPKKIFLENKGITSEGCLNQSMVSTAQQVVVACQSDDELRINKQWLLSVDSKNRAGLILHEMTLGFARSLFQDKIDKVTLEKKVRQLNRYFFNSDGEDISRALTHIFGIKAYSAERYSLMKSLPGKLLAAQEAFCSNPKQSPKVILHDYFEDKHALYWALPREVLEMDKIADQLNSNLSPSQNNEVNFHVTRLCVNFRLDQVSGQVDIFFGTRICGKYTQELEESLTTIIRTKENINLRETTKKATIAKAIQEISNYAFDCYEKNNRQEEALFNLPQMAKWRLNKLGININFVNRTAE